MQRGISLSWWLFLLALLLVAGCADDPVALRIEPEVDRYLPTMSSAPGLGLSAVASRDLKNSDLQFHWSAEQGTFLRWSRSGAGRVQELGPEVRTDEHRIYWHPLPDTELGAGSFRVHVSVVDRNTGDALENASLLIRRDESGAFYPETDGP